MTVAGGGKRKEFLFLFVKTNLGEIEMGNSLEGRQILLPLRGGGCPSGGGGRGGGRSATTSNDADCHWPVIWFIFLYIFHANRFFFVSSSEAAASVASGFRSVGTTRWRRGATKAEKYLDVVAIN